MSQIFHVSNIPLPRYQEGDYPVSEALQKRVMGLSGWIRCADGLIPQLADAIRKVSDRHGELL